MRQQRRGIGPLALLLSTVAVAHAQDRPVIPVARAAGPIVVDGKLDDPAWASAAEFELGFQVEPGESRPAPVKTEGWVTFDERRLIVAIHAYDPDPRQIRAHYADRDGVFRNDLAGFVVDPFDDARRGFLFVVNPLGVQSDAQVDGAGPPGEGIFSVAGSSNEDYAYDAIWESAARITDDGWTAEIAVPFTLLRFPRTAGPQTWGFLPVRVMPRSLRTRILNVPLDRGRNCLFCQIGKISGLTDIRPGRDIELDPTLIGTKTDTRDPFPGGPLSQDRRKADLGITGRWGFTPNLSLGAAINPDFSQVEADAAQLSINERFALFYPEKRPFFLEGKDFFATQLRAVYTRTLAEPDWGLKVTGKEGANAIGAFIVRDHLTNLLIPGNGGSVGTTLDVPSTGLVLRWRRDVGQSSTIGLLAADRGGDAYNNRYGGVDANIKLTGQDSLSVQWLRSSTEYPQAVATEFAQPDGRFGGNGGTIDYVHNTRRWAAGAGYYRRDPSFRADLGFIPQVDLEGAYAFGDLIRRGGPGDFLARRRIGFRVERNETVEGRPNAERAEIGTTLDGPLQSFLRATLYGGNVWFRGTPFQKRGLSTFFNIRPTGDFTSSIQVIHDESFDFEGSGGRRPALVDEVSPGITWNLGRHFYLQVDHSWRRSSVDQGRLFTAQLTQVKLVWQFNVRTFVRGIFQWEDLDRNLALYQCYDELDNQIPCGAGDLPDARSRSLFTQALFSYKLNPQTVLFAGYSDRRLGSDTIGLTTQERTLFVKLGYAWVL